MGWADTAGDLYLIITVDAKKGTLHLCHIRNTLIKASKDTVFVNIWHI